MASPRAIARALARGAEKEAVKPRAPKPLTAEEIAAARHVFRAGDDVGYNRNYVRGVMKFTADGMTPEARLARSREMGIDPDRLLYHQTKRENVPSILSEGFDLNRVGARGSDDVMPDGVFLKDTPRDIGVGATGDKAAQIPLLVRRLNMAPVRDRGDLQKLLDGDAAYQAARINAREVDKRVAREFDAVWDNLTPDDDGSSLDGILERGRKDLNDAAAMARARGTQVLRERGFDGVEMAQDAGGISGKNIVRTTVVLDPANIRSPNATFDPARANRRDLLAGVVPVAAAGGAAALASAPQEAQAAEPSALARALAREAPRFNAALDTSLDVASFFDPSMGYATETARALKDLPGKVGPAGAVALAPLTGATEALASVGQLPELGVAGGRAIARAIARKPAPRGSGTYRKAK